MATKEVSAFDAMVVRQAFNKLAESVTFNHQTQRTLRQAAHDLAELAHERGTRLERIEGGREGSLKTKNAQDRSRSSVPPHPSVVGTLVPVSDETIRAVAGPMHEVISGELSVASMNRLRDAVVEAIAPKIPANALVEVADAIVAFALTRRELAELAREFPELASA